MKVKIIASLVVLTLCLMVIPVSEPVSADETLTEEEVHDAVYLQCGDTADMDGYNLAVEQDIAEDEYESDENVENAISLDVDVYDTNSMTDGGNEYTEIKVRVTADAYADSVSGTPPLDYLYYNGYGINLAGYFTSPYSDADPGTLDISTSENFGTQTTGEDWYNQNRENEISFDAKGFAEDAAWGFYDAVSPVPIGWASTVADNIEATQVDEYIGNARDFGEEASIDFLNELECEPEETTYQAQTVFEFQVPHDASEYTLHLSATSLLGFWDDSGALPPSLRDVKESAEATVDIPIKNAEPDVVSGLDTDKDHYEASEYSDSVYPDFDGLVVENPAGCNEPVYEVKIEWSPEWDQGWETLTYDWLTHGEEIDKDNVAITGIPDDGEVYDVNIRYTIEVDDEYGGWEVGPLTLDDDDTFTVTNEEDDNGGGGGGGGGDPPPNLPSGDDTWFEEK